MAMKLGSANGKSEAMVEMNTTPLIDVLLVLLVMLILTIPMQTHAVKLDMPHGLPITPSQPSVDVVVDFDGSITWNGRAVPDRSTLDTYLANEAGKPIDQQSEIHLRPDRLAKYEAVAIFLSDAQRIGVRKIGFAGNEQYME
jgi:biopolymer transport protein ExbD